MWSKKLLVLAGVLIIGLFFTWMPSFALESFDSLFEWTDRFRMGEEVELSGITSADSFTFLRSFNTAIDRDEFKYLIGDSASQLPLSLKILVDGERVASYQLNRSVHLEEIWKEDEPIAWSRVELVPIASYPRSRWSKFLKEAVSHGLQEYQVLEEEENLHVFLTFTQTGPSSLRFGRNLLQLPDNFYNYMRTDREFVAWNSNNNRFVILVHEPHWCLAGQYQLLLGLKALLDANISEHKFKFLVEGYFVEETKDIPTKPLLTQFSSNVSKSDQVFCLLRKALIDGPLAYRLIYDPDLPAVAIDDPDLIKETPKEERSGSLVETFRILRSIANKLEKLSSSRVSDANEELNRLYLYVSAKHGELAGQPLIDFEIEQAKRYDTLSKSLYGLSLDTFSEEISYLKTQADALRRDAERFQISLKRDVTMANNIVNHFTLDDFSGYVPVVFIGNFHTAAIVSRLRSEGIGFVVVEPRDFREASDTEYNNFNSALNLTTRRNYLRDLAGDLKLPVAPTSEELPYYRTFLERKEVPRIERENQLIQQSSESVRSSTISWESLRSVLEGNGFLNGAEVSFADQDATPPPPFTSAFAYISEDPQNEIRRLVFLHPDDKGWEREDRYRLLGRISLVPPREEIREQTTEARFYQDRETNRIFCSYFDPVSNRFYLFEGETMNIFDTLPMPKIKNEEEAPIHIRVSVRKVRSNLEADLHG